VNTTEEIRMLGYAVKVAGLEAHDLVLPEGHHVIVGAMRFHYLDWGGNGHPLLFLHGGGLNAHTWDVVALMLHKRFRCIALDQRGHGESEWSAAHEYGVDTQVGDIEGFVELLRLENPLLVGQSMGGLNAIAYAIRHSERIKGLVVVDVGHEINPSGAERFLERATKFNPLRDPEVLRRSLFYNLRQLPSGKWTLKHDQRRSTEDNARANAQREHLAGQIEKISSPTLIIRGARSDILSDEAAQKFAGSLPRGRWVRVEGAGHNVQGDNPRGLLEAIDPFLDEIGLK
jgi:pimeloyl-ACP methyl ester carboxylesterase